MKFLRTSKNIITGFLVLIFIVIVIYLLTSPKQLGSISHSYSAQTTSTSDISFFGEAGDRIKFSFVSDIEKGDLNIILYDSKGNEVYKLDKAKELETFFNLNNSDNYILKAECSSFIGKYYVKLYNANQFK